MPEQFNLDLNISLNADSPCLFAIEPNYNFDSDSGSTEYTNSQSSDDEGNHAPLIVPTLEEIKAFEEEISRAQAEIEDLQNTKAEAVLTLLKERQEWLTKQESLSKQIRDILELTLLRRISRSDYTKCSENLKEWRAYHVDCISKLLDIEKKQELNNEHLDIFVVKNFVFAKPPKLFIPIDLPRDHSAGSRTNHSQRSTTRLRPLHSSASRDSDETLGADGYNASDCSPRNNHALQKFTRSRQFHSQTSRDSDKPMSLQDAYVSSPTLSRDNHAHQSFNSPQSGERGGYRAIVDEVRKKVQFCNWNSVIKIIGEFNKENPRIFFNLTFKEQIDIVTNKLLAEAQESPGGPVSLRPQVNNKKCCPKCRRPLQPRDAVSVDCQQRYHRDCLFKAVHDVDHCWKCTT